MRLRKNTYFVQILVCVGILFGMVGVSHAQKPMLIINEDNDHYFKQKSELMTEEALQSYIDQFANTKVTHFFMCPNGQRTSYRSAVHEAIWDEVGGAMPTNIWCVNAKLLNDRGIDPYKVWIKRCRENQISPWITMRMNDVHFVTTTNYFRNTNYWRKHPELWRVPNCTSGDWMEYAFDYSKSEVREYHLALVRELFGRYDFDGFETDWLRFPWHLTPGKAHEQGHYITQFMREVRSIAKEWEIKRGHPIGISVRVSADPDAAAGMGTDAVAWAKDGLVDLIVASCFFSAGDFDIPLECWKERLGALAERIPVVPGIDDGLAAHPGAPRQANDLALYYGWAAASRYHGANSFYLFNLVYFAFDRPPFRPIIDKGLDEDVVSKNLRRHPVTYRDAVPKGFPNGAQLPKTTDKPASFTIHIGKKPASGKVAVVIGLSERAGVRDASFVASLNGLKSKISADVLKPRNYGGKTIRAIRFEMPLEAACDGVNTVEITADADALQQIVWAEIEIDPMSGYQLVWQDEFNCTTADLDKNWDFQNGPSGHILCSRWRENAVVENGVCRLLNKKETRVGQDWTSASIWTRRQFKYGFFECRYRYGASTGLNNSFWIMTRGGTTNTPGRFEIDINEGHIPHKVNMNIHNWSGQHWSKSKTWKAEGLDLAREFHVYGLDWSEKELVWFFDGMEIRRETNTICYSEAPVLLSSAIIKWAGPVTDQIDGTAMEVDYVRVYERCDSVHPAKQK
ncbi:MAG: hypothetical protein A2283_01255 [Lentisphaerae bacterium RIFOXYA12_FULL_48_11]|nr:MAG: hypothetical protein A2283_01255 [Lentisphaerae bacterium RIFOXYA12_FULL_48_11]